MLFSIPPRGFMVPTIHVLLYHHPRICQSRIPVMGFNAPAAAVFKEGAVMRDLGASRARGAGPGYQTFGLAMIGKYLCAALRRHGIVRSNSSARLWRACGISASIPCAATVPFGG
jgi:hypothetical protein